MKELLSEYLDILVDGEVLNKYLSLVLLKQLVKEEIAVMMHPYLFARARREIHGINSKEDRGVFLEDLLKLGEEELGSLEGGIFENLIPKEGI